MNLKKSNLPIMVQYPKSKYMAMDGFSISKNPKNSIFDEIKQSLFLDPFDLNVDQFDNRVQKSKI